MKRSWLAVLALFALTAKAQNINFQDIPHIHTALRHLTVIDLGEPIQLIAAADPDSFQIERAGDKVLLQPLKEGVATNLILWTSSRQLSYELDAPGDVAQMNVLIRNMPSDSRVAADAPSATERQKIAVDATASAILGAEELTAEERDKRTQAGVSISIVRVLHSNAGTYLEYSISNRASVPFRVTTPQVTRLSPSQAPLSLVALRNHQLSRRTVVKFQPKPIEHTKITDGACGLHDMPPGSLTTGYVLFQQSSEHNPEMYQLDFGSDAAGSLIETVVI